MCLAIPARVLEVKDKQAKVDFGQGVTRSVDVSLVEAEVGDYILVHAGYAIEVLNVQEAEETLRLWREMLSQKTV